MTATATSTRKPTRKPERSATLGSMTNGKLLLWLTQDGETRGYILTPLPSDFGTAYRLAKADNGDGHSEEYDILLNGRETSCTCPGHTYRAKCKHVDALNALLAAGKLSAPAPKQQPAPQAKPAEEKESRCFECGCPIPPRQFYCERHNGI